MALTFANKVTIARILVLPFFIISLLYYTPSQDYLRWIALGIFAFAVISDVVDGYIARIRHQKTRAGAILDPLADKLLLISAFICLYVIREHFQGIRFPLWLVIAVISRDMILLLGSMIIYIIHRDLDIEPSVWGKATTFFQVLTILGMLLQISLSMMIWYIMVGLTIISGFGYIRRGIKVLNNPFPAHPSGILR